MVEGGGGSRVYLGHIGHLVDLWWDTEMNSGPGEACFLGQIFAGFIERGSIDRRWRGWVQTDDAGQLLGHFETRAEAKQAVCDAVIKCAAGTFVVEVSP